MMGLSIIMAAVVCFTGCASVRYFKDPDEKYKQKPVKDSKLTPNTFYVKDGTYFTSTYMPSGTLNGSSDSVSTVQDNSHVLWTQGKEKNLIPTLYKNEFLALQSSYDANEIGSLVLERYYDIGYSLGIYGAQMDGNNYITFSVKANTIEGSTANTLFQSANSDTIKIVSIDGKKVDSSMINKSGVFTGLKKDETYHLSFYAGSAYQSANIKADTYMFTSFETYSLGSGKSTRKTYIKYTMPKGAKSGYYLINGVGLFRYFDFIKGAEDEENVKMNVPFYKDNNDQMKLYSQQYSVNIPETTYNIAVNVKYSTDSYSDDQIICTLVAPDNTTYSMKAQKGTARVALSEAMAGKWMVNIYPKDLEVLDVNVDSTGGLKKATTAKKKYKLKKPMSNLKFCAEYAGEGTVWGTVTYEDGTSQDMMVDDQSKKLYTTFTYAKKGTYTVTIYHYEDVRIERIYRSSDENNEENYQITTEG